MRSKKYFREEAKTLIRLLRDENLHLRDDINRKSVCKRLGLSKMQLHTMLKRNFGESYTRYLNRWRVEEAKKLLSDPETRGQSKQWISEQSGFKSISQFNVHFKRLTGMTPTEYELFSKHFKRVTGRNLKDREVGI